MSDVSREQSDLDAEVSAAKEAVARAQADRARAEHRQQVAIAVQQAAAAELDQTFGVASLEAALVILDRLEAQLRAECEAVTEALAAAKKGVVDDAIS